jgi:Spy/CpxP family protein refolding chaperone
MEYITKTRWQVRVAAGVIFVLGFAAGILTLNVYRAWAQRHPPTREDRIERMAKDLQLTADQKTKVLQVFNDTREQLRALRKESEPKVAEIRKQADERIQQTLTPEQWQRFQQLRKETWGERRRGRDNASPED